MLRNATAAGIPVSTDKEEGSMSLVVPPNCWPASSELSLVVG